MLKKQIGKFIQQISVVEFWEDAVEFDQDEHKALCKGGRRANFEDQLIEIRAKIQKDWDLLAADKSKLNALLDPLCESLVRAKVDTHILRKLQHGKSDYNEVKAFLLSVSDKLPNEVEAPIDSTCPPCPGVVTQSKHENLWKAASELSRKGFFTRKQLLGMDCVKQTSPVQIGKWLTQMKKKGLLLLNGKRRAAEWRVK